MASASRTFHNLRDSPNDDDSGSFGCATKRPTTRATGPSKRFLSSLAVELGPTLRPQMPSGYINLALAL